MITRKSFSKMLQSTIQLLQQQYRPNSLLIIMTRKKPTNENTGKKLFVDSMALLKLN